MSETTVKKEAPALESYAGKQLSLFQDLLCNTDLEKEALSNTIKLWDAAPKYFITRRKQQMLRKNGYLESVTKYFRFGKDEMYVQLFPARIEVDGKEIEAFPSAREEIVEDALRKLATKPGKGFFKDGISGVSFTLHELRNELKKNGHTMSYYQVVESLKILKGCGVHIGVINEKAFYETSPITSLSGVSLTDLKNDPKARWHVEFSLLVSRGIKNGDYRQYHYALNMRLKTQLCRWLHKRMSHNYVQASMINPYNVTYIGVMRDSGLLECAKFNDNRRKLEHALNALKDEKVIMSWSIIDEIEGPRKSITDVHYKLVPHHNFIAEQKRANARQFGPPTEPVLKRCKKRLFD